VAPALLISKNDNYGAGLTRSSDAGASPDPLLSVCLQDSDT
jgi:hypothetical protein